MSNTLTWPTKSRELHNHHFDSTVWNGFRFRDDDIISAEYEARAERERAKACAQWLATGAD